MSETFVHVAIAVAIALGVANGVAIGAIIKRIQALEVGWKAGHVFKFHMDPNIHEHEGYWMSVYPDPRDPSDVGFGGFNEPAWVKVYRQKS